jgi:tetratricopeptide (TPR) repeat protein
LAAFPRIANVAKRFEQLLDEQQVYLEKLIALNPEEPEYRFQLALVSLEQGDAQRGMAIIQNLAPASEPGYATAHFWLANYLVQLAARASDQRTRLQSMSLALKHAEHCLIRDQGQLDAKRMKAMLLEQLGRREAAYATYEELFDTEVAYYERLVALNERLKREDRSQPILDRALAEFRNRLSRSGGGSGDEGQLSTEEWVRTWMHVTKCRVKLGDFDDAVSSLQNELNSLEGSQKDNAKRVFLSQLIAEVYLGQLNEIDRSEGRDAKAIFRDELELFRLAKKYSPRSPVVLKGLARISFCDYPDLAAEARSLYVPEEDDDAPADVLNELGSNALARGQYRDASRYFELANKKSPKNPFILNNLAYTYLVRDDANPARALKLIDEALRYLPAGEARMQVRSNFYDTRGTALMQLGRLTEAIAAFEIAIQDRPDKREILESLIKCYEDSNLSPEVYVKRLGGTGRKRVKCQSELTNCRSDTTPGSF